MKKNIIVLGDSFCSSANQWPQHLADLVDRNLLCYTEGAGQSWWSARQWLQSLNPTDLDLCDLMVFAHTNAERIPTDNKQLGKINHSAPPVTEIERSISLYYKYIFYPPFLHWAQQQWFKEISELYGHKKLVHLHCFSGSKNHSRWLKGINISTSLISLSLNELGAKEMTLFVDDRPNHLNEHNNKQLATQLAELIRDNDTGNFDLDHTRFQQTTLDWLDA